jgi:hypothetical protein
MGRPSYTGNQDLSVSSVEVGSPMLRPGPLAPIEDDHERGKAPPDDTSAVKTLPTRKDGLTITTVGSASETPARG